MRDLAIIRVCPKDQRLASRCEKSIKEHIPDCSIIWFAEEGKYEFLTRAPIYYRPFFDNFGGRDNVLPYLKELKNLPIQNYKNILLVDSDITFLKNPLDSEYDLGGIQDYTNKRHFSGQCIILKSELLQSVLNYEFISKLIQELLDTTNISIADDTVISWIATTYTENTKDFFNQDYWVHSKKI